MVKAVSCVGPTFDVRAAAAAKPLREPTSAACGGVHMEIVRQYVSRAEFHSLTHLHSFQVGRKFSQCAGPFF